MNSKTTVVYHRADYDGIFCREIARKFLPEAELIGWDYGDAPIMVPPDSKKLVVMDLPLDAPFGFKWDKEIHSHQFFPGEVVWIDHHKSSIESHPKNIPGYRIDGVAACRLAWQWFLLHEAWDPRELHPPGDLPNKQAFVDRAVSEPLAVRLAGEYDIWDHRDNDADVAFQFGLDAQNRLDDDWPSLLSTDEFGDQFTRRIVGEGRAAMQCYKTRDAVVMQSRSFITQFDGLTFLCLNTARCNSNTFAAKDIPETGHDGLLAFYWTGKEFSVSLYHAAHRKDLDLSLIAVKHGGGGHRGACGFRAKTLPFVGTPLESELISYLNRVDVHSDNIGDIRRACFVPWDSKWNSIVRDETAARERKPTPPAPPTFPDDGNTFQSGPDIVNVKG